MNISIRVGRSDVTSVIIGVSIRVIVRLLLVLIFVFWLVLLHML